MLEDTAFELRYTAFEPTTQVLRMADQSRVIPVGRLSQIPTRVGETTYPLNYVVIRVNLGRPFPMLLGRPWLYLALVMVDWGAKEFRVGKPTSRISWDSEKYLGETEEVESYTSDWSEAEDTEDARIYFVNPFEQVTEEAVEFSIPVREYLEIERKPDLKATSLKIGPEDRPLGEASVELNND